VRTHAPTTGIAGVGGAALEEARPILAAVDPGVVMFRRSPIRRLEADSRRFLARQLADYASDADRNDLELIAEATQPGSEVSAVLSRQAGARLFRAA
jgi:hypothetical protein